MSPNFNNGLNLLKKPKTVLAEWWIWFSVLAVGVGLVLFSIFAHGWLGAYDVYFQAENFVYLAIFSVAIFTLIRNYKDAREIDKETALATEQVQQMADLDDLEEFLDQAKPSLFRSHIDALYKIFKNDHEIRQENLVSLLQEKMLAQNRLNEQLAGILLILGLIGTVVGLIDMMTEMNRSLDGVNIHDPNFDIVQTLTRDGGALSSLGTAYYMTLFGALLGGVTLKVLTNFIEAKIISYTAYVAELTEVNVLPQMRSLARQLERSGYYSRQHEDV